MGMGGQSGLHAQVTTQLIVQWHCCAVNHQSSIHAAHLFLPRQLSYGGDCLAAVTATHMHVFPRPPCVKVPLCLAVQRKEDLFAPACEGERAANVQPAFEEAPLHLPASPLDSREPSSLAAVFAHGGRESDSCSKVPTCVLPARPAAAPHLAFPPAATQALSSCQADPFQSSVVTLQTRCPATSPRPALTRLPLRGPGLHAVRRRKLPGRNLLLIPRDVHRTVRSAKAGAR